MKTVAKILEELGPSRASAVVQHLKKDCGISEEAARQRVSRSHNLVMRFPISLLPNKEKFIYLEQHRTTENFWMNFQKGLRETKSVYAAAIDGLANRGGIVELSEFPVISGAPIALKKQVTADMVARNLKNAGVIEKYKEGDTEYLQLKRPELGLSNLSWHKNLRLAEGIILGGMRQWARNLGLASYDKIAIRGDKRKRHVGAFAWDLTGPSYIMPVKRLKGKQGFLVADVFAENIMHKDDIEYFVRKAKLLQFTLKEMTFIPILVAAGFTPQALSYGRSVGVILASISNLFGSQVAQGIQTLIETLNKAAATAIGNPQKLVELLNNLVPIEGAAGNLRGILFELISVYLAKKEMGGSVDHATTARDPETGKTANIDVLCIVGKHRCVGIECKGKNPGGVVSIDEVQKWISQLPTFKSHLVNHDRFREAKIQFELWTTGSFSEDSLSLLEEEKRSRSKTPINWKDGNAILDLSRKIHATNITDALNEHYLKHPLNT